MPRRRSILPGVPRPPFGHLSATFRPLFGHLSALRFATPARLPRRRSIFIDALESSCASSGNVLRILFVTFLLNDSLFVLFSIESSVLLSAKKDGQASAQSAQAATGLSPAASTARTTGRTAPRARAYWTNFIGLWFGEANCIPKKEALQEAELLELRSESLDLKQNLSILPRTEPSKLRSIGGPAPRAERRRRPPRRTRPAAVPAAPPGEPRRRARAAPAPPRPAPSEPPATAALRTPPLARPILLTYRYGIHVTPPPLFFFRPSRKKEVLKESALAQSGALADLRD